MANVCTNMFYAFAEDENNIKAINEFFESWHYDGGPIVEWNDWTCEFDFYSRWCFPEDEMKELFNSLPNKNDIYMRVLSYEFGNYYHDLWVCNENGWRQE